MGRAKILGGSERLVRHHMYVFPRHVVLSVLQKSQIKAAKLVSNFSEVRSVSSIVAEEYFVAGGGGEGERNPTCLASVKISP